MPAALRSRIFQSPTWTARACIALAALLAACATESISLESADSLPDSKVSILRAMQTNNELALSGMLNGVTDLDKRKIILKSEAFKDYRAIRLTPGYYEVVIKAYAQGKKPAFPRLRLRTLPGKTYWINAYPIMDGQGVRLTHYEMDTPTVSPEASSGAPKR